MIFRGFLIAGALVAALLAGPASADRAGGDARAGTDPASPDLVPTDPTPIDLAPIDLSGTVDGLYPFGRAELAVAPDDALVFESGPPEAASPWTPLSIDTVERGYTGDDFLLRFTLVNTGAGSRRYVLAHDIAFLDRMEVWVEADGHPVLHRVLGNDRPFAARPVEFPGLAYPGTIQPGEVQRVTLRLGMIHPQPMTLGVRIWDEASFQRHAMIYQVKFAGLAVAMLTMAVTWTVFAAVMARWRLLLYAGYLWSMGASALWFFGLAYQTLFPTQVWIQQLGFQGWILLAFGFAALFADRHLEMRQTARRLGAITRWLGLAMVLAGVAAMLGLSKLMTVPLSMVAMLTSFWLMLVSIVVASRHRSATNILFATGWTLVGTVGIGLFFLVNFHLTPVPWPAAQTYEAMGFSTLIEVLILTLSVALSVRSLQDERDRATEAATIDPLTGLLNRRGFDARLATRAPSREEGWWLAVFDLDRFKAINDSHGHAAGDAVLETFARTLRDVSRQSDIAGRLGGEEFALVFRAATVGDAGRVCDRIREAFGGRETVVAGEPIRHTVSGGVARLAADPTDTAAVERAIRLADQALYRSKAAGRDRVTVHGRPPRAVPDEAENARRRA